MEKYLNLSFLLLFFGSINLLQTDENMVLISECVYLCINKQFYQIYRTGFFSPFHRMDFIRDNSSLKRYVQYCMDGML